MKHLEHIITAMKPLFSFFKTDENINKQLEKVKELIAEKDLSLEEKNYLLITAIEKHSNEEIIKYLIEIGADVNGFAKADEPRSIVLIGDPLLMVAVKDKNLSLVKLLVENGADIYATNKNGFSNLLIALVVFDMDITTYLLKKSSYNNDNDISEGSINEKRFNIVKNLISDMSLSDKETNNLIFLANDTDLVAYFLESGIDLNSINEYDTTLLMFAIVNKNLSLVKFFLEKGANANAEHIMGITPLMQASDIGFTDAVTKLLEYGADINMQKDEGKTALMISIEGKETKTSKVLIDYGANVNLKDDESRTALMLAIKHHETKIAKKLIDSNTDINAINKDGIYPLLIALLNGNIKITSYLLDNNVDVNKRDLDLDFNVLQFLLFLSLHGKKKKEKKKFKKLIKKLTTKGIIHQLIQHGIDINAKTGNGQTILMWASELGLEAFVDVLLQNNVDVNAQDANGHTALIYAIMGNKPAIVDLLLQYNANPNIAENSKNFTALIGACELGNIEMVNNLIIHSEDIHMKTEDGYNALYFSVIENQLPVVKLLLENGMDINETFDGKTLLLLATNQGHEHVVEFLLHQGVDVDTTYGGYTALMSASKNGYFKIVELLIDHNADINMKINKKPDENFGILIKTIALYGGENALSLAAKNKHYDIVDILLSNGAKSIKSLGSIVLENNDIKLLKVLVKHEFNVNSLTNSPFTDAMSADILRVSLDNGLEFSELPTLTQIASTVENLKLILDYLKEEFPDENISDYSLLKMYYKYLLDKNNLELLKVLEEYDVTEGQSHFMVNITSWMERNIVPFMTTILLWPMIKLIIKNLKTSEQKQIMIESFSTNMHLNLLHKALNSKIDIDQLKMFINSSTNINIKDKNGLTPLMLASKRNNIEAVKLLLSKNAKIDLTDNSGKTALQYAAEHEDIVNLLRTHMQKSEHHNPEKLVEILKNFTIDTPIKYTTHEWRNRIDKKYINNFDLFLNDVNNQLNLINNSLNNLSPNLHRKINSFISGRDESSVNWYSKGNLPIGWSSMEGLKEWVSTEIEPFDYPLPKPISNDDQLLSKFGEVIELFKNEIEIRENMLQEIFLQHKKRLGRKFKINISDNLKGEKFYTDVEKFRNAIDEIFREIEKYAKINDAYKVSINLHKPTDKFIELEIIHIDSYSHRDSHELLERIKNKKGDIGPLSDLLVNLCDWFIVNKDYKINCFDTDKEPEALSTEAKGFTHIMRFYK